MQQDILCINILITCHNRVDKTIRCLQNVYAQDDLNVRFQIHIFLVDDGSIDNTTEIVSNGFPEVIIIKGDGNLFWNRGMNTAWKAAERKNHCNYFLWLNNDTFLYPDAINQLLEVTADNRITCGSTCSAVTGKITYGGINKIRKSVVIPNGNLQNCDSFTGNCVLIPYTVFEKLGYLHSAFHHGLGDLDYGLRATKNGIHCCVAPDFIGTCELHDVESPFFDSSVPLTIRFHELYKTSCLCNPYQRFIFENEHTSFFVALFHLITIHVRVAFPSLWNLKYVLIQSEPGVRL